MYLNPPTNPRQPDLTLVDRPRTPPLLTWLILPMMLIGVTGGTWLGLDRGLPKPLAATGPLLMAILITLGLERIFPLHRAWNRRPDGVDIGLIIINRGVDAALLAGTSALVSLWAAPRAGLSVWPTAWPLALQVGLGIFIAEGLRYAMHTYSHRPGFWWRVHRTHHAPDRMYVLNGPRLHPLNYLWVAAAHTGPMLVLGAPVETVLLVMNTTAIFVVFQHANLDLRFDGLRTFLATPDVHRLHHAKDAPAGGANFSVVLTVFDRLFGTYVAPTAAPTKDGIGLEDGA